MRVLGGEEQKVESSRLKSRVVWLYYLDYILGNHVRKGRVRAPGNTQLQYSFTPDGLLERNIGD